jgi:hypothetical protein
MRISNRLQTRMRCGQNIHLDRTPNPDQLNYPNRPPGLPQKADQVGPAISGYLKLSRA